MSKFDGTVNSVLAMRTKGAPEPEPGMGVTELYPGDRYPGTIAEVIRYKTGEKAGQIKAFTMWRDEFEAIPGTGHHEPKYKIIPTPLDSDKPTSLVKRVGDGWRVGGAGGTRVAVGFRDAYRDPHF